ncbi:hypothetical protein K502DRAFT_366140 [Neoconidiobolus thromboides FSU 785]|nr:hypothetical protein K502DRAFT_366140 [Neoconidiobolus thromboides FSU 785]
MSLTFEFLSEILLEEIFKYVSPIELFNLQFLNKYLFKVVNNVIKFNLTYSIYNGYKFKEYYEYQNKFIKENGGLMKHVSIEGRTIECLKDFLNVTSIEYTQLYNNENNDQNNNKLKMQLPGLKKLVIHSSNYAQTLMFFKDYLKQLEVVQINSHNFTIEDIITNLNPAKLGSLVLNANGSSLYLQGLDIIKTKFNKLKKLQLKADKYIYSSENNPKINFTSSLELKIEGKFNRDFSLDIQYFGNLQNLKSVMLLHRYGEFFNRINKRVNIKSLKICNKVILGYFDSRHSIDYDFLRLPNLKQIYVSSLDNELLKSIFFLSNIKTIQVHVFHTFGFYREMFYNISDANSKNLYTEKRGLIQCPFVKEIEVNIFASSYVNFLLFLSLFPNLEILKITDFYLMGIVDTEVELKLTTPLLLLVTIPDESNLAYEEVEKIPMLNWIKL